MILSTSENQQTGHTSVRELRARFENSVVVRVPPSIRRWKSVTQLNPILGRSGNPKPTIAPKPSYLAVSPRRPKSFFDAGGEKSPKPPVPPKPPFENFHSPIFGSKHLQVSHNESQLEKEERLNNLFCAAKEICDTERKYDGMLHLIAQHLEALATEQGDGSSAVESKISEALHPMLDISRLLTGIREAHRKILNDMENKMSCWNSEEPNMASCVEDHVDELSSCLPFLERKEDLISQIRDVLKEPCHKSIATKFESIKVDGLPLPLQLDVLVHQNIGRYEILLKSYRKFLIQSSREALKTESAIRAVHRVVDSINSCLNTVLMKKRQSAITMRLKKFEASPTTRQLLYEGDLEKVSKTETKQRYFILFSDVLLIARTTQDSEDSIWNYEQIPVEGISAEAEKHIEREKDFQLRYVSKNATFRAKTKTERDKWVEKLNDASAAAMQDDGFSSGQIDVASVNSNTSDTLNPETSGMSSYILDERTTFCMMEGCNTKFGAFSKKPHCQHCGWIMCDKCTGLAPFRSVVNAEFKVDKVCPACYELILEKFQKDKLFPEQMVDRSQQKESSSMEGVRVNIGGRLREWKELFKAPAGEIRPKIRITDDSVVSGTLIFKSRAGAEKRKWGRLVRSLSKENVTLNLYSAELDKIANKQWIVSNRKLIRKECEEGGLLFELQSRDNKKDVLAFRVSHSTNAERWNDALTEICEQTGKSEVMLNGLRAGCVRVESDLSDDGLSDSSDF